MRLQTLREPAPFLLHRNIAAIIISIATTKTITLSLMALQQIPSLNIWMLQNNTSNNASNNTSGNTVASTLPKTGSGRAYVLLIIAGLAGIAFASYNFELTYCLLDVLILAHHGQIGIFLHSCILEEYYNVYIKLFYILNYLVPISIYILQKLTF